MSDRWMERERRRRAGGVFGFFFLIAIVAIFFGARALWKSEERARDKALYAAMTEPDTMLDRYFMELTERREFKEGTWRDLLEFQSSDDLEWFNRYYPLLASLSRYMEGIVSLGATDNEKQFGALEAITRFGPLGPSYVVSRVEVNEPYAVAYIHTSGSIDNLREVFLIKEGSYWKIRRFLGGRDFGGVMNSIVDAKMWNDEPLTPDEALYYEDPSTYNMKKRRELLTESGFLRNPNPEAATPAPTPASQQG